MTNIENCFGGRYAGRTVLVTGHTGFKGSWLCLWLEQLGARVVGYSLPAPTQPNHYERLDLNVESNTGDIRDLEQLKQHLQRTQPDLVLHLAAQSLVRASYERPGETFTTNVTGTMNVLEAARGVESIRAIVCVTSDKVYENVESEIGYRESDRLGGCDPYSNSKACAELVVSCYRDSFFPLNKFQTDHSTLIATARAGNVMGGGDWAADRLIPDAVRAAVSNSVMQIRNPNSIRPWQHVLEPLAGYLILGDRLLNGEQEMATAWNFGPDDEGNVSVREVVDTMQSVWPQVHYETPGDIAGPHETCTLKLDSALARKSLKWLPVWSWRKCVEQTTNWYKSFYDSKKVDSREDLNQFIIDATMQRLEWTTK